MKKQVILIYDQKTKKVIGVPDVRSLTTDEFTKITEEAKLNLHDKVQKERELEAKKEEEYQATIENLTKEIKDLKQVILHILGYVELPNDEIETILEYTETESEEK